jgi:hypothetical protein
MPSQLRQPRCFELRLACGPVNARQTNDEVVAEAPDGVVSAPRSTTTSAKPARAGHLRGEETPDERFVHRNSTGHTCRWCPVSKPTSLGLARVVTE